MPVHNVEKTEAVDTCARKYCRSLFMESGIELAEPLSTIDSKCPKAA